VQELVRVAFKRGSVHTPEGEEEEPTPAKVRPAHRPAVILREKAINVILTDKEEHVSVRTFAAC
jgi:hypothetical protein